MERPCLSRRRALGMVPLTAAGMGALAACGPEDEGFGDANPVRATDGEISLDDVPENQTTLVNFGGQQPFVALVRGTGEDITAFSGYCTHNGCALAKEQDELHCPCHGSGFDPSTGEVLRGPASTHLPTVPIVVENNTVRRDR